jgi:hypothetical protein
MNLENELRKTLREKAEASALRPRPQASVLRRARARAGRGIVAATLVIGSALFLGTTLPSRLASDERAFAAFIVQEKPRANTAAPTHEHPNGSVHGRSLPGQPVTPAMLNHNRQCMRAHGFDLPDPVQTSAGWQVIVEDSTPLPSESPDYNVRKRWAEAVFVDCRVIDAAGDLVFGGRTREQIDGLMACARSNGFVLPEPTEPRPGEFVFDLKATSPRWGSQGWYRTVFVTCGLWRHGPDHATG